MKSLLNLENVFASKLLVAEDTVKNDLQSIIRKYLTKVINVIPRHQKIFDKKN